MDYNMLKRIQTVSHKETKERLFAAAVEELGEYSRAMLVEQGDKNDTLTESARMEAVDLILCGIALYFAEGGSCTNFDLHVDKKLFKWEKAYEQQS